MIKHYLSSIYGLDITKVNTVNYDGERKRVIGKRGEWYQVRALLCC
jgi:ribosomal protein L23